MGSGTREVVSEGDPRRRGEVARRRRREAFERYWLGWHDARSGRPENPPTEDEMDNDWYVYGYLDGKKGGAGA